MKLKSSNKYLLFGFSIQILLMIIIVIFNLSKIDVINNHLKQIVNQSNVKVLAAYRMDNAARERFISINDIINSNDPFERENHLNRIYSLGTEFLKARNTLYDSDLTKEELKAIEETIEPSRIGSTSHHEIITLIEHHESLPENIRIQVKKILNDKVLPSQNAVKKATQKIIKLQRQSVNASIISAEEAFKSTYRLMGFLGGTIILISIFIAWNVIRHTNRNQAAISNSEKQARIASQSKSDLLAIVSHELRTPLTSLIGFNELMANTKLSHGQKKISKASISAGKTLLYLVNDILDFSKIEKNKMILEACPFSLSRACSTVFSLMQDKADQKNLELTYQCDKNIITNVIGDQLRLQQIMTNLIGNAIKFTDHGVIQLLANIVAENDSTISIQIEVKDTGIGIEIDALKNLFKPFEQGDPSISRRFGGTGLGLTVSSKLVEEMGGKLIAYSTIGKGSTFSFILEFKKFNNQHFEENNSPTIKKTNIPSLSGRILIAEDTPDLQLLIKLLVGTTGASTTIVDNGNDVINHVLKDSYDLILMDMRMPLMDGIETTSYLRNEGYQIPIVALTANSTGDYRVKMLEAGCTDILNKPIDQELLYKTLSTHLKKSDASNENVNHELAEEMLEIFIIEFVKNIDIVLEASKLYDTKILKKTFHKIKGNAGSFGFTEISELAAIAEKDLKLNNTKKLTLNIAELQKHKAKLISGEKTIGAEYWAPD